MGTMTRMVEVKQPAGPDVAFTWSPDPATRNQPVSFDASATADPDGDAVTSYTWDWGDGTDEETATDPQRTKTFETAGTYAVKLTATDETGAKSSRTAQVEVREAESRRAHAAKARRRRALAAPFELAVRLTRRLGGDASPAPVDGRASAASSRRARPRGSLPRRLERRAPAGLRAFRDLRWVGRLDGSAPLAALTRVRGRGVVLAASVRSPRTTVCLRLNGGLARGRFRVLGGTGTARRLRASGGFGRRDTIVARTGRPRGLPRPCRALRAQLKRVP